MKALSSGQIKTVAENHIGTAGELGFGLGIFPGTLPSGFSFMPGSTRRTSLHFGNYQYSDGSIMCWVPAFYYKIGTGSNGLSVNIIDIKPESAYADESAANTAGYALHRAFKDGGETKRGFFVDKYQCSNNSGTASSLKNGNPLSTASTHNPIADLDGSPANNYAGTIDAIDTRGTIFQVCSRFIYSALAMLSMAHGQAATSDTYCAWYDGDGNTNYPKGNNDDALGDTNDGTVSYTSDGHSNAGKTGSGDPFAKTTHNGQESGVADLNGNMWEVTTGLVRDSGNNDFYALKESVPLADLTSGSGTGNDAWGDATHLGSLYDVLTATHITDQSANEDFGNGANQVLSEALTGNDYLLAALGWPKDGNAQSASGSNLFGQDALYERHRADLCVISGGDWGHGSKAGVWCCSLNNGRGNSSANVGFRAACYSD